MKQAEDTVTLDLPLPWPVPVPVPVPVPAPRDLGGIARDIARGIERDMERGIEPQPDLYVPTPGWRLALNAAISADPEGKKGVAERLGVSRPYVSRITTGHIAVASRRFVARVEAALMQVDCPHLLRALPPAECRAYAQRSYAQISQFDVGHWRACRTCPCNPTKPTNPANPANPANDKSKLTGGQA